MKQRDTSRDVAIIGLGCRFAKADDVDEFWDNLVAARPCFGPIPADRWDHDDFHTDRFREHDKTYVTRGAFIDDVDSFGALHFGIAPRRVEVMDPQHRLVLETTRVAMLDAGVEKSDKDLADMGTFLGISTSEYRNIITARTIGMMMAGGKFGDSENVGDAIAKSVQNIAPISAFSMPGNLLNMAAANISNHWKLGGPAFTVDAACASSLVAVHDAVTHIRAGICKTAIAGGVYLNLTPETVIGFSRIGAISQNGACRPFDAEADGFLQGDGCGMVVLKNYDEAIADGDRVYAVIRGCGINNDAGSSSGPMAPSLDGQKAAVERAYRDANVDPRTVGFVSCHGTATPVGDPVEVTAIREVFFRDGEPDNPVYLGSAKANIGHTMSAAGVAGLIHATLAVHRGTITPQAGFDTPHGDLHLDEGSLRIPTEAIEWSATDRPRRAGVSAFGFGGTNCHLVLEQAPRNLGMEQTSGSPQTVVLHAENRELLADYAELIADRAAVHDLQELAYTLSVTRKSDKARLAVVASTTDELVTELRRCATQLRNKNQEPKTKNQAPPKPLALGPNAYWSDVESTAPAFMFPGQGAQRVGLFRELYERYDRFAQHLDELSNGVEELLGASIRELLYPEDEQGAEERLTQTEICQPVMAALGLALHRFLGDLGIEPSVCLGHSLGEFAAAAAGGLISDVDAVRFVAQRGRLMANLELDDPGAMAAIMAPAETVELHLVGGAQIANLNHPQQTVISGETAAVEATAEALTDAGIKATLLSVSHAFHSPLVEPVKADLRKLVDALELSEGDVPVISAITGAAFGDEASTRETFVEHTTSTVDFMAALRAASEHTDVFVEVGSGKTLTAFAQGTLGEELRAVRSLGSKESDDGGDFQRTLAMLAAAGLEIDFAPLHEQRRVVSLPPAPLLRSKHWVIRDRETPLDVPASSRASSSQSSSHEERPVTTNTDKPSPSSDLVALFREQNEILRQHAAIIAAQNAALSGTPVELPQQSVPVPTNGATDTRPQRYSTGQQATEQQATEQQATGQQAPGNGATQPAIPAPQVEEEVSSGEPRGDESADTTAAIDANIDYETLVMEAVAGVSAFPPDALSSDQQLAKELGFDSLMFVDLVSDLQTRLPGLAIPQDAFDQSTSIGDVVTFLKANAPTAKDTAAAAEESDEEATLRRFVMQWRPLPTLELPAARFAPHGVTAVTTRGPDKQATLFAEALRARGCTVRIIDLDDADDLGDATALVDFAHRELGWNVDNLVELRRFAAALWETTDGAPEAFVTVTSGFAPAMDGAFRGFAKALDREWTDARVLAAQIDTDDVCTRLLSELDSPLQQAAVRYVGGERMLQVSAPTGEVAPNEQTDLSLGSDDLVAITGGAKGIGLLCARALLSGSDAKLLLIGRSKEKSVKKTLGELRKLGSVDYLQWDVAQSRPDAFAKTGQPTAIIHAAGVIRDARVHEKSDDDVRLVAGVKVDGLLNVLEAAGDDLKLVVGFGSWAGRFGNAHQTDYSAANDAMTALLEDLGSDDLRAVNIDWPVWEDSTMASSIPDAVKQAMRQQGVTFLSPEEGTAAFIEELEQTGSGEVLYSRRDSRREAPYRAQLQASLETLPYVGDHIVRGAPIVPFAGSLDWLASAAAASGDWTADSATPLVLRDVQVFRPLDLTNPLTLEINGDVTRRRGTAQVLANGELAFRASVAFEKADLSAPQPDGNPVTSSLDLKTFYEKHSFHGPKIQGIARVDGIAPNWIVGTVKTSTPAQLLETETDRQWTIDPLVIDATMQLVLFHLQSLHGFGAIPTAIDEYVQLRPFVGDEVKCTMELDEMADGNIVGTIVFEDDEGIAAKMTRLRAKEFHFQDATDDEESVEIDEKFWNIAAFPEVEELEQRLQMAELIGIRNPYFWPHDGPARNTAMIEGREMINYSSYNYCGFSGHPDVSKAAQQAVERYGTSVSASRIASGQIPLHQELEDAIADFIGTEASLVFSAGHMTNETCIGHLFGKNDLIIHDSLAHNSILTGAELSGAKRMQFPHSDYEALEKTLQKLRGNFEKVGIFIEGVYSMDGDIPDLPKFIALKRKYKCLLYVDEAHSMGVIGPRGAGISDYYGLDPMDVDVWMGTLSKSFASCGGYITGSQKLIDYLKYTAPAFVFSAGISPANAAAALASVTLLGENPEIPQTLQARSQFFLERCNDAGLDTGMSKDSAVVPVIVGNSIDCLRLSQQLSERGINVQPIVYPAVEDESSRLRFFLSAVHTEDELRRTADIVAEELGNVRAGAAAE